MKDQALNRKKYFKDWISKRTPEERERRREYNRRWMARHRLANGKEYTGPSPYEITVIQDKKKKGIPPGKCQRCTILLSSDSAGNSTDKYCEGCHALIKNKM